MEPTGVAGQAVKQTEISSEMSNLNHTIELLAAAVDGLKKRIEPVMNLRERTSPGSDNIKSPLDSEKASQLANALHEKNSLLQGILATLRDTTERVEL